ncbi:MAG TPA: cupin domain-containing protein [Acidimicrobiia bacterium]|nr:cupin domain-containing protein [Acidimicrobiia bacterium]
MEPPSETSPTPREGVVGFTPETIGWTPHPFAPGLDQAVLLSKRDHGADATIYLYRASGAGFAPTVDGEAVDVPLHEHEASDDISYVLAGSAEVDIEGHGTIVLGPGSFLRIPAGSRHRVRNVSDDFQALNIFAPPRD